MEQEREHRMALLEKLAQQVPYYDKLQDIEADLSKTTAAVDAATYVKPDAIARGHFPLNGFSDTEVRV